MDALLVADAAEEAEERDVEHARLAEAAALQLALALLVGLPCFLLLRPPRRKWIGFICYRICHGLLPQRRRGRCHTRRRRELLEEVRLGGAQLVRLRSHRREFALVRRLVTESADGGVRPERRGDLAKLGVKAMIGGTIAAMMTGSVAGLLY